MIDSVSFYLEGATAPELENTKYISADYFRGNLGNLKITQYPDSIYCTGSLAKFLQGNNVLPLTRQTVEQSLDKLVSKTGWDLNKAKVTQLEVGATIQVQNEPSLYLDTWGSIPRFVKQTYQKNVLETVTYSTGSRSFSGYNKRAEAESSKQEIPLILNGSNLLRLELKYKRGLKQRLGRSISPWDLANRELYSKLVDHWKDFYFSIPKGRQPVINTTGGISPKDLDDALLAYGVQCLGLDSVLGTIKQLEKNKTLGQVQASRARKKTRDISKNIRVSIPDDFTSELDSRVREIALYAR